MPGVDLKRMPACLLPGLPTLVVVVRWAVAGPVSDLSGVLCAVAVRVWVCGDPICDAWAGFIVHIWIPDHRPKGPLLADGVGSRNLWRTPAVLIALGVLGHPAVGHPLVGSPGAGLSCWKGPQKSQWLAPAPYPTGSGLFVRHPLSLWSKDASESRSSLLVSGWAPEVWS